MEISWFDLISRVSSGAFVLGVILFALALLFLRVGRKGGTWRLRRTASKRGGRLLIFSFGLWMIAVVLGGVMLVSSAVMQVSAVRDRAPDDLYGIVLPSPTLTPALPTHTPTVTASPPVKLTPTATDYVR
jgi:hypothetical protein